MNFVGSFSIDRNSIQLLIYQIWANFIFQKRRCRLLENQPICLIQDCQHKSAQTLKNFYIMSKNEESTFLLISYQQHHRKSFPHIHSYYLQSRLDSTWELWKKKIPVQRFLIWQLTYFFCVWFHPVLYYILKLGKYNTCHIWFFINQCRCCTTLWCTELSVLYHSSSFTI